MGQKQAKKSDDGHKNEKGRKNEETSSSYPTTVVLKIDMHCDECASKIVKCLHAFRDVESLKPEMKTESVDPIKPKDKLSGKTKKNVDIASPVPDKDKENKPKNNEKKTKDKEAPVTTTVLKVLNLCSCQGCSNRIRRVVLKIKGVKEVSTDREKGMVMVKGTMDVTALVQKLSEKLRKKVEVVPPKKEKDKDKDKEKEKEKVKEKEKKKKESESEKEGDKGGNGSTEKKKERESEKEGDKGGNGSSKKKKKGGNEEDNDKENEGDGNGKVKTEQNNDNHMVPACGYGYGYGYGQYNYMGQYYPASEMFSDENPHACHIM